MNEMKTKVIDDQDDGYISDIEDFKSAFQTRIKKTARIRQSNKNVSKPLRRVDSLARLLETNAICVAVYLHPETGELWIASNKIHGSSRTNNEQFKTLNAVFSLVSEEDLAIKEIFKRLATIISINFAQEKRYEQSTLKSNDINTIQFVEALLEDLFSSNCDTKSWINSAIEHFSEEDELDSIRTLLIKKTAKITRDFLKLRDFLLQSYTIDPIAKGLLEAIRYKRYKILHIEGNDVHAEMRIIANQLTNPSQISKYIGISKLCCGHCAVAMEAFDMSSRGLHGQATQWPLPAFISSNTQHLSKYLGNNANIIYRKLPEDKKHKALEYISNKDSNPLKGNARSGRAMTADSSDSDVTFGMTFSDSEDENNLKDHHLADTWTFRNILLLYKSSFDYFKAIGLDTKEIIDLYQDAKEKFEALSAHNCQDVIERLNDTGYEGSHKDIHEKLSEIFDKHESFFWRLLEDEEAQTQAIEHGLEAFYNRYQSKHHLRLKQKLYYIEDDPDDADSFDEAVDDLVKENGWDYSYDSDDSENCWKHKDDDSSSDNAYQSDGDDNSVSDDDLDFTDTLSTLRIK